MFWGLVLEPGKRYSTTVEKSFHVSKAVLDCASVRNDNEILKVVLETEGSESLLCNLCKQRGVLQENLDLNFVTGDRLTFECRGNGRIYLSGYLLPDDDEDMSGLMEDEDESEEEEMGSSGAEQPSSQKSKKEKRKLDGPPDNPSKKKKMAADDDDDDDEDGDGFDAEGSDLSDLDDEDLDDEEGDDDDDEDEEDVDDEGSDDEEEHSPKQKNQKNDKTKTPNKQNLTTPKKTPVTNGMTPKEQKSNKKTPGGTPAAITLPKQKQVLEQGVVVKDIKIGTGPPVKPGKTVGVLYLGKLKEGGKVFDKNMKGDGFKFKLGKGDVIRGWDIGIMGMKVGGKRVIHCPPEAAYGAKGAPPKIPPNSSLVFEVEVLSAN